MDALMNAFSTPNPTSEDHTDIYNMLENLVTPQNAHDQPPLRALTYAIRSILEPPVLFNHTPDLLNLLAQVELIREVAYKTAGAALEFHKHFSAQRTPDVELLSDEEVKILRKILSGKRYQNLRKLYLHVKHSMISLHIVHLWTSPDDSYRLPVLLKTYFPLQAPLPKDHCPPLLLHARLSDEEQVEYDDMSKACIGFTTAARDWEERYITENRIQAVDDIDFGEEEFRALVEKLLGSNTLELVVERIDIYLNAVQKMVDRLQEIFPAFIAPR